MPTLFDKKSGVWEEEEGDMREGEDFYHVAPNGAALLY